MALLTIGGLTPGAAPLDPATTYMEVEAAAGPRKYPLSLVAAARNVLTKTSNYTALAADNGVLFSNAGAGGAVTISFPLWAAGLHFGLLVEAAQNFIIDAAGSDVLNAGGAQSTAGGTITCNVAGSLIWFIAGGTSGQWYAIHIIGGPWVPT